MMKSTPSLKYNIIHMENLVDLILNTIQTRERATMPPMKMEILTEWNAILTRREISLEKESMLEEKESELTGKTIQQGETNTMQNSTMTEL